jgi:hypothetical protein
MYICVYINRKRTKSTTVIEEEREVEEENENEEDPELPSFPLYLERGIVTGYYLYKYIYIYIYIYI